MPQPEFNAPSVGIGDLNTQLKLANQNMSQLIETIAAIFPRATGTFTLSAAVSTVVPQTQVTANSIIQLTALNAAAGTLMGSAKSLYISARTAGASFTVATASGGAAVGTEEFQYWLINPV